VEEAVVATAGGPDEAAAEDTEEAVVEEAVVEEAVVATAGGPGEAATEDTEEAVAVNGSFPAGCGCIDGCNRYGRLQGIETDCCCQAVVAVPDTRFAGAAVV